MNKIRILLVAFMFVFSTGICKAQSSSSNEQRMLKLEAALSALQAELNQLKTQQSQVPVDQEKLDIMVSKMLEEKKADMKLVPDWVNNVKIKGDFRYRHEWTDDESATNDRNRNRIRARIGIYGKVNDEVDYGFRLASGNTSSPTSTNQDLDGAFSSKNIWLDLAYFDYHPENINGLTVLGGKMKNPLFRAGKNNLMFDNDVNPEGVAVAYTTSLNSDLTVFGNAGAFYVEERSGEADTSLWAMQAGVTYNFPGLEKTYVTAGGGYFDYGNIKGVDLDSFAGNKNTGSKYDSDFDIAQGFVEVGFPVCDLPFKVFGDYLKNTSANSSEDTGYLIGATIGKCKKPGSWQFGYNYRDLEADAVVGALTEGTFGGGGTNVKGHSLCLGYQLAKNVQLAGSYFLAERTDTPTNVTTDHDLVLVDLKFKF